MKLLVIGPDIQELRKVKNFTGVQAFYIARELRRRGVSMRFVDNKQHDPIAYLASVDGGDCDHVLALGLRWFTHQPVGCSTIMKSKTKGAVTQLHDGLIHDALLPHMTAVDCTFTFRDDSTRMRDWERYSNTYCYIGWAADPDYLYPAQDKKELRILIDHPYYKNGQPDITEAVTKDASIFASFHPGATRVRRLINGGAEDVTPDGPMLRIFNRQHVPFPEICEEYRRTHIYMVTHKESVGLTCLELGMCGALVVAPAGMVYQDRLNTVRHISYEGLEAPWQAILESIDPEASALVAREQTWAKVVDRMLAWFGSYK